jgi:hypothetical protein
VDERVQLSVSRGEPLAQNPEYANEFHARLFVADKALDPGEVELVACRN